VKAKLKITPEMLRASYDYLKKVAFHNNRKLPASKNVTFLANRLKNYGYHLEDDGSHTIWVSRTEAKDITQVLQIMAHEMCHAVLVEHSEQCGEWHDAQFKALARIIEVEMGWTKGKI
jgi:predicted SprT family Zn-dependent metalloprotease